MKGFDAVKVFTATKARQRVGLGEDITEWIREKKPNIVDYLIRQSSDNEFHCLSIILFMKSRQEE